MAEVTVRKKPARKHPPSKKSAMAREQKLIADSKIISQAVELRKAGLNWQQISEQLNIPQKTVWEKVHKYLNKIVAEPTDEMRQLHYERYNFMLSRLWPGVINGNTNAVNSAMNVMGKIEKLYGLEAPVRSESVNINIDPSKMVIGGSEAEYVSGMVGMASQIDPALLAKIPPHLRKEIVDVEEIEN